MLRPRSESCRIDRRAALQTKCQRRGTIMALVAGLLPVIVALAAFFINVAYMELCRTELRIATDSAVRAGGRELATTGDVTLAKAKARDAAGRNLVAGAPLQLADDDFRFGLSIRGEMNSRYAFQVNGTSPNALQLRGKRTAASADGAVRLFFPNVLGLGTFEPVQEAVSTQIELDIVLVLDRSGSMAYAASESVGDGSVPPYSAPAGWVFGDAAPPDCRWRDAVAATQAFLAELDTASHVEKVGLATYNHDSSVDVLMTYDPAEILAALDVYTQSFDQGATNIGDGIHAGLQTLFDGGSRSWASKVIVLMTDGNHNTGTNPVSSAYAAKGDNVTIYTITFSDEANTSDMKNVANITHGAHYHADNASELTQAFRDIAAGLPTLLTQ